METINVSITVNYFIAAVRSVMLEKCRLVPMQTYKGLSVRPSGPGGRVCGVPGAGFAGTETSGI